MNLIFTFIVTGIMVVLGLLSLGDDFPYTPLYIVLSILGLGVSYWQQTKRDIPYLRIIANLILVALTVKALFPFFAGKPRYDMFTALIATWIYFLVLSTYIIHTKRDYYIIQGLSLGLIVYACFYATHNPLHLLGYTAAFLVIWIMALRNSNLFTEKKEKTIFYTTKDIWREVKLGAVLFLAVVILSLPFYFLLPRFNIPLLPMDQLLRQRYSAIYSDFPKRGLVAYLSRNPKDIMTDKREKEGETPSPAVRGGTLPQLDLTQNVKKPIFWHGKEAMDNLLQQIKNTDQQLKNLAKQKEPQRLIQQEEKTKEEKKKLEKALQKAKEEQEKLNNARENLPPEETANPAAVEQLEEKIKNVQTQIETIAAALKELDAKIEKIEELKRELVQLNKPTEIEKAMQQYQQLTQQEEKIIQQKKELEQALQQARQEYAKLDEAIANLPPKQLVQLVELKQKMQAIENKIQAIMTSLKDLDARLQKIEEAKTQVRAYIYQEAVQIAPEIRQLWDKKEEQQKQLAAMQEQMAAFVAQQQAAAQQQPEAAAAQQQAAAVTPEQQIAAAIQQQQEAAAAAQQQQEAAAAAAQQQATAAAVAAQQQANQEEIEQLEQKVQATTQEIQNLAQQNNLPQVQKDIQEHQNLINQEETINQQKKELEQTLQQTRQEYVAMAALQANPPQELAGNATALKELENKMKNSVQKIENMANERKSMDKQIEKIKQAINNIRDSIYKQSARSTQKIRILFDQKEEQLEQLRKAKEEGNKISKTKKALVKGGTSSQSMENEEEESKGGREKGGKKKTETQKTTRQITILDIILYILVIITLVYVLRSILVFIFPYLRHKRRISQASRKRQYNLSVSLIYNFLGRVLYIFGYKYPVVMLPEEYLRAVNKRFAAISHYTQNLTNLFIEARYSDHRLNPDQERQAFENYRNILQELKNTGAAWQRQILKIGFLFEL